MLTLQILDRDEPFLVPLVDRAVLLGSAATADVHLDDAAPEHARIECSDERAELRALGDAEVRVNGQPVRAHALQLGDRIEIGGAVLVVGRSVTRPKRPEDVLAERPARAASRSRRTARGGALVPILVTLLAAGGVAAWVLQDGGTHVPAEVVEIDRLRRTGKHELAKAQLARLQAAWRNEGGERRAMLDAAAARLAELDEAVAARRAAILAVAAERSYAEFCDELQREEKRSPDETTRIAARIVRGSLMELLQDAPRPSLHAVAAAHAEPSSPADSASPSAPGSGPPRDAAGSAATAAAGPGAEASADRVDGTARLDLDRALQDVDRFAAEGLFAQALAVLQNASTAAAGADQPRLEQRRTALIAAAQQAHDALVAAAREHAAGGACEQAIAELQAAEHRFPQTATFTGLGSALRELQARQAEAEQQAARARLAAAAGAAPAGAGGTAAAAPTVDEATRRATLEQVRAQLERIRSCEDACDFAGAARAMREGAAMVASRDPDYGQRLLLRAEECEHLAALQAHAARLLDGGKRVEVPLRSGRMATLHGVDDNRLRGRAGDADVVVAWLDLAAPGVLALAAGASADATLGAAALLYREGEPEAAETLLAKLHKADAAARPAIDRAIARGRGDFAGGGYTLGKEGFVSARSLEAQKQAQKLVARLDGVLRSRDAAGRQAFLREALAQGPRLLEPLVLALRGQLQQQVEQLGRTSLKKQLDRLAAQRAVLDEARAHAKELIFDEVKYFYPFRPPQVSSDKFAEYNRVQAEVDRRVDALRTVWRDDRAKVRVPASLRADLDRLDWTAAVLADLGGLDPAQLAEVAWARALPPGDVVTVATYCRTVAERDELVEWQRIEAFNRRVESALSAGEREQLHVTNAYRVMFGHRPLAVNPKIHAAARGHAEEMSELGYFAHFSPTPGRRTPFDRMKLAGYAEGASENIANCDGAENAHIAWCHSSGHHRNLLNPAHTEFGVGGVGRYWVQNFGRGRHWVEDPSWQQSVDEK